MACVCHMQASRRKVCILWKLEGDISISEGEIPPEFAWWDITRARRETFSTVRVASARVRARASTACVLKRSNYALVTFGVFEVCNAYYGASFGRVNGHVLAGTRTFDPAAQKGGPAGVAWASKGVRIVPVDAHAWT